MRVELLSVMTFPQFWFAPDANTLDDVPVLFTTGAGAVVVAVKVDEAARATL
jgi:hypothetical protein